MNVSATLTPTPDAHHGGSVQHWRRSSFVTDGGGAADVRRASSLSICAPSEV
jgi:hypothetical protein